MPINTAVCIKQHCILVGDYISQHQQESVMSTVDTSLCHLQAEVHTDCMFVPKICLN